MLRYLPVAVAVVAIVSLTVVQSLMSDRFVDSNVTAEQRAKLLKNVPIEVGEWRGTDLDVTEEVRDTAGAVGCVSRTYRNGRTGEEVSLWIIVGHARDVSAHTPEICYRGSGFAMRSDINALYPFSYPEQTQKAEFWTNTFVKEDVAGRQLVRVFWAWYNPKPGDPVSWQAAKDPRWTFGNTRALFKMYFTSSMKDPNEPTDLSAAAKFGREFLPKIEQVLSQSDIRAPADESDAAAAAATAEATPSERLSVWSKKPKMRDA
jgi:hypothetical protein